MWKSIKLGSSNNSSSVFDFSLFWLFALNTDHRYKCPIDGMEYLQLQVGLNSLDLCNVAVSRNVSYILELIDNIVSIVQKGAKCIFHCF